MALPKFKNETSLDWSKPANRRKQEAAIAELKTRLGREYPIVVGGERITTGEKFASYNPSQSSEVIGVFQKGDAEVA
ncbi:MAG: L-glutamate gamma-semialdehyde dehydrogenase, partial [Bacteroidetes bacterium]|nr:L-glutamate gamma-semialdehyde dehydrogenase [Bacteroidota bacterium]